MNTYTSNSTLCCHWCKIPLGNATQVTYLNGNLPICDLCLGTAQAQILSDFAEKDKRIAELEKKYEAYKISNYDPSESIRLNSEIMHQKNRIAELEATVERMKCCGNCKAFHHCRFRLSDADVIVRPPENFDCNKWEGE